MDLAGDKQNFLFNTLSAIQLPSDIGRRPRILSHARSTGLSRERLQRMRYINAHLARISQTGWGFEGNRGSYTLKLLQ